jgi:hypothetical protein
MTTIKSIVCLANSRKLNGRCVAGREVVGGQPAGWIRPVSGRPSQEVSEYERQYDDGSDPRVLDIIDVPLLRPDPKMYQQENWRLDPKIYWVRTGRATWKQLGRLVEPNTSLWTNGCSTYHGRNDVVPVATANTLSSSLTLIRVSKVQLVVFSPGEAFGNPKRRVQARFSLASTEYRLWVTDPDYERRYLARPNGSHDLAQCLLTISLGEPYKDECSKLVAAIIERTVVIAGEEA